MERDRSSRIRYIIVEECTYSSRYYIRSNYNYIYVIFIGDENKFFLVKHYNSLVFFISSLILLLDPTLLSFLSSSCLCLVILDYAAPIVISKAFNPDSWTGPKEKKLDEICSSLAKAYVSVRSDIGFFLGLKETRPKLVWVLFLWIRNFVLKLSYLILVHFMILISFSITCLL